LVERGLVRHAILTPFQVISVSEEAAAEQPHPQAYLTSTEG
jgi:hypothetical protein